MISLPMIPNDASPLGLFPEAVVLYKFERASGYVSVKEGEAPQVGYGYWILFSDDHDYVITGQPIYSYNKTIYGDGWEMIGGCACPSEAFINNGNINMIYKYVHGKGYVRLLKSEDLESKGGYWILINNITGKAILTFKCIGF